MDINELEKWLEKRLEEAKKFFPDNDSQRAGYIEAIDDVLDEVRR